MRGGARESKERTSPVQSLAENRTKTTPGFAHTFGLARQSPIALTGTWCAPGIREGAGAGLAALTVALSGDEP